MGFSDDVKAATGQITDAHEITIISHIDADGISSEAILSQAIARSGFVSAPFLSVSSNR